MAGAYVAKPDVFAPSPAPPGWNVNWPFIIALLPDSPLDPDEGSDGEVGPEPPGEYTPHYSLLASTI